MRMFKVFIDPLAEKDIDEIFSWYESKRAYLGFLSLEENPFAYYNVTEKVRRITVAKFPV
jgi:hypothetical protein